MSRRRVRHGLHRVRRPRGIGVRRNIADDHRPLLALALLALSLAAVAAAGPARAQDDLKKKIEAWAYGPINLVLAVRDDRMATVDSLLAAGVPPDQQVYSGCPMIMAAAMGNERMTARLLAAGAKVDGRARQGTTPLQVATYLGRPSVMRRLLSAGASPMAALQALDAGLKGEDVGKWLKDVFELIDDRSMTWLPHSTARDSAQTVRAILLSALVSYRFLWSDYGGNADTLRAMLHGVGFPPDTPIARAPDGKILLDEKSLTQARRSAIGVHRYDLLRMLLNDARPALSPAEASRMLEMAARDANLAMVDSLLSSGVRASSDDPVSAAVADYKEHPERRTVAAQHLLAAGVHGNGARPLIEASKAGALPVVRMLIDAGAPLNSIEPGERDPRTALIEAADDSVLTVLLKAGADPNLVAGQSTALDRNAAVGRTNAVRILLAAGARPDRAGSTLYKAIYGVTSGEIIKMLLAAGAAPVVHGEAPPGQTGRTGDALSAALSVGRVDYFQALLDSPEIAARVKGPESPGFLARAAAAGTDATQEYFSLGLVKALLEAGATPNETVPTVHSPALFVAAHSGRPQTTSALLAAGASVNGRNKWCKTPLGDLAANPEPRKGHVEVVKALLAAGADPNLKSPRSGDCESKETMASPLFEVADQPGTRYEEVWTSRLAIVNLLLAAKADPNAKGPGGKRPIEMAQSHGYSDIVEAIRGKRGH